MKTIYALAISLALGLAMNVHAAIKSTDEMSKMSSTALQNYLKVLPEADFNLAMQQITYTGNTRFIRLAVVAAQNVLNYLPLSQRPARMASLLGVAGGITGTIGATGKVLLTVRDEDLKTSKIGVDYTDPASQPPSTNP